MENDSRYDLDRLTKTQMREMLEARDRAVESLRTQNDVYYTRGVETEKALAASRDSLAELEKVQQEIVARLEQAYLALVKVALK